MAGTENNNLALSIVEDAKKQQASKDNGSSLILEDVKTQSKKTGSGLLGGNFNRANDEEKSNNLNTTGEILKGTAKNILKSLGAGVTSGLDNISDAAASAIYGIKSKNLESSGTYTDMVAKDKAKEKYVEAKNKHLLGEKVKEFENKTAEDVVTLRQNNPDSGLAKAGAWTSDLAKAAGQMLPSVGVTVATGGLGAPATLATAAGLGVMGMNVYDQSFDDSIRQGYDAASAGEKALGDAVLETATELMFGGIAGLGKGVISATSMSKLAGSTAAKEATKTFGVKRAINTLATSTVKTLEAAEQKNVKGLILRGVGEGIEEMVSEIAGPVIERATTNPDADDATIQEILLAGLGGAVLSFAMAPLGNVQTQIDQARIAASDNYRQNMKQNDAEWQIAMMRNIANDTIIGEEDTQIAKAQLGIKGDAVDANGNVTNSLLHGIKDVNRQRIANKYITQAEQENTPEARAFAWQKLKEQYDADLLERTEKADTERYENAEAKKIIESDSKVAKQTAAIRSIEQELENAKAEMDSLATDVLDDPTRENQSDAYKAAEVKYKNLVAKQSEAQLKLEDLKAGLTKKARANNKREANKALYGEDTVQEFERAQRVADIAQGRIVVTDAQGNMDVVTKSQLRSAKVTELFSAKYGEDVTEAQLTGAEKAKVTKAVNNQFDEYQKEVRQELENFVAKVNEAKGDSKINLRLTTKDTTGDKAYTQGNTIIMNANMIASEEGARYYLSHEMVHALERVYLSETDKQAFRQTIQKAMSGLGYDFNEWYYITYQSYSSREAKQKNHAKDAKQRGLTGKAADEYVKSCLITDTEEEVYARFMQTLLGSQKVMEAVGTVNPGLLDAAERQLRNSSVRKVSRSVWDYARLKAIDQMSIAKVRPIDVASVQEELKQAEAETLDAIVAEAPVEVAKPTQEVKANMAEVVHNVEPDNLEDLAKQIEAYDRINNANFADDILDLYIDVQDISDAEYAREYKPMYGDRFSTKEEFSDYLVQLIKDADLATESRDHLFDKFIELGSNERMAFADFDDDFYSFDPEAEDLDDLNARLKGKSLDARARRTRKAAKLYVLYNRAVQDIPDFTSTPSDKDLLEASNYLVEKKNALSQKVGGMLEGTLKNDAYINNQPYLKTGDPLNEIVKELSRKAYNPLGGYEIKYRKANTKSDGRVYLAGVYDVDAMKNYARSKAPDNLLQEEDTALENILEFEEQLNNKYADQGAEIIFDQETEKFIKGEDILNEEEISRIKSLSKAYKTAQLATDKFSNTNSPIKLYVLKNFSIENARASADRMIFNLREYGAAAVVFTTVDNNTGDIYCYTEFPLTITNAINKLMLDQEYEIKRGRITPVKDTKNTSQTALEVYATSDSGNKMAFTDIEETYELTGERLKEYEELMAKYGAYDSQGKSSKTEGLPTQTDTNMATNRFANQLYTQSSTPDDLKNLCQNMLLDGGLSHLIISDAHTMRYVESRLRGVEQIKEKKRKRGHYNNNGEYVEGEIEPEEMTLGYSLSNAYADATSLLKNNRSMDKNELAYCQQVLVEILGQIETVKTYNEANPDNQTSTDQLYDMFEQLLANLSAAGTRSGQNLQAFSLLKKMTPTGRLYYIDSQVGQLLAELNKKNGKQFIIDATGSSNIDGYRYIRDPKTGKVMYKDGKPVELKVSEELREKFMNASTLEELDALEEEAIQEIAAQIPPSLHDRVTSWRYLAMLGNPRTHIRNIVSNVAMGAAVKTKNRIGGALEDAYFYFNPEAAEYGGRQKTLKHIDPELKASLKEFAEHDWANDGMSEVALTGSKVGFQSRIDQERQKMKIGLLDKAGKANSNLLEAEDDWSGKRAYKEAFVVYCAANGLTPEILSAGTTASNVKLAQARNYACTEAAKATYHDANEVATLLNKLEKQGKVYELILGGLVPFKKTPANILKRGINYSPVGLVLGLSKAFQLKGTSVEDFADPKVVANMKSKLTQGIITREQYDKAIRESNSMNAYSKVDAEKLNKADSRFNAQAQRTLAIANAIDQIASGLTGTGLMLIGVLLSSLGIMKGGGSDKDREEYYDQMLGYQKYSITINGENYTLDWLTPVSMPLFAGVELHDYMRDGIEDLSFSDVVSAVFKTVDPVMNLSLLQGINDAMGSYDTGLGKMALSSVESFAGQFIPTLAGQVARTIDPVRRTTYAQKDEGKEFAKEIGTFVNRMENKIPGLSKKNSAYVDMWGRNEVSDKSVVGRFLENAVFPFYSENINVTPVDDYVSALFEYTGDNTVLPTTPDSYNTVAGVNYYLTPQEYETTKELVGQISYEGVGSLMEVPEFAQLTPEQQADIVGQVYSLASRAAKEDYYNANGIVYDPDTKLIKITYLVENGVSLGKAMYIYYVMGQFESDKNENGKPIKDSKKKKVIAFCRTMGLTDEQILSITNYKDVD